MKDFSFILYPEAATSRPPFAYALAGSSARDPRRWRIQDGRGDVVGHAPTRAGARAGVHALHHATAAA
ncbi:MAG: hypothetical protein JF588_19250 [Caulobacterales bacterium]|nr:hypothetical protein [Caulobacterales bacterium]